MTNLNEELERLVRDFTTVIPKEKSIVRNELLRFARAVIEEAILYTDDKAKTPWQSLQFGDCPKCGQKVNRVWVDNKCKEIYNSALTQVMENVEKILGDNK